MGADQQLSQSDQQAAQLAALTLRVEALEHQLVQLSAAPAAQPLPAPPPPAPIVTRKASLEDRIGAQLFSRIGILALLIAVALFLKWAIDNQWIGPIGRVLTGLIAGAAVILWSQSFLRKGFPAFSYALKAIGTGALYLSLWAAFQLYHLLPAAAALAAMIFVTAWNAYMAWSQSSELLAAYALAGALVTPLLLSTGGDHEIFLFTYLLAIDVATVVLVRLKSWPRLLVGAFPATVAYFIAWYFEWYNVHHGEHPLAITTCFVVLFSAAFILSSLARARSGEAPSSITQIFLPLANAAFLALALYSVFEDAGYHDLLAWIALLLAAIYLGLMRLPQTNVTSAVHLATAIVFLTIAIPLKASGRWITTSWLTEGAALLWVSARLAASLTAETRSELILRRLAACALVLGVAGLLLQSPWFYGRIDTPFFNSRFATSLYGVAVLAASAFLSLRVPRLQQSASPTFIDLGAASIVALNVIAILAVVRELELCWPPGAAGTEAVLQRSLAISGFLMLYGGVLLGIGFWRRSAFLRWQALVLLVFTTVKTFLYDLRNLGQGYGVLSFLGLGALLMAVSFAYQKDWLSLRAAPPEAHPAPHEAESGAGH